jgi:hypothetical protein
LDDLSGDGWIILKFIVNKRGGRIGNGFIYFRIGTSGELW